MYKVIRLFITCKLIQTDNSMYRWTKHGCGWEASGRGNGDGGAILIIFRNEGCNCHSFIIPELPNDE